MRIQNSSGVGEGRRRGLRVWLFMAAAWLLGVPSIFAEPLRVVTTTGMIADLTKLVGGELVTVEALMGPGVDPHLYKATASDVRKLQRADLVLYNGLLLEGKMTDIFARMQRSGRHVYAITEHIPHDELIEPAGTSGHPDPHLWFDVELWARCIEPVVAGLTAAAPEHSASFRAGGERAQGELGELHAWATAKANELPVAKRILVTSHDAYNYFGRAYGFRVVGLQGISTVSEAALADMARLVDFIRENRVKAIFVESSVPHATIERIATDAGVVVGGELFSDAMGTLGEVENDYDLGTFEGMVKHNLTTMVEALK